MAEDRAVAVHDPKDAHEVAAALLRLADEADQRGQVAYLDEDRRRALAGALFRLARELDPTGWHYGTVPELYVACPACGGKLRVAEQMRCGCGRNWAFALRQMD